MQSTARGEQVLPSGTMLRDSALGAEDAETKDSAVGERGEVSERLLGTCDANAAIGFSRETLQQEAPCGIA